ncbi:hypothetical protein [Bacillus sp. KH172YL63]|nr:hypothetical protein [Bacillus sp. KH172YL63]BCB03497.1 hypothetical protein KH172YL63_16300 [Bacillus sp. KH172YL63]
MKSDKEVLERVKELCEQIIHFDKNVLGIPDDSHIDLSMLILNEINKTK